MLQRTPNVAVRRKTYRKACDRSIAHWRVPKRQQTVKVESLKRLKRAEALDPARDVLQPERVQYRDGRKMQERQVAEARLELPIANRKICSNSLLFLQPFDSRLLVA